MKGQSPVYLLFLSKFMEPKPLEWAEDKDYWREMLHEKPKHVSNRLVKEGMIEISSLPERIAFRFTIKELQKKLQLRNIKTSGAKNDLIQRLIEVAPDEMDKISPTIYQCTAEGRRVVEQYLAEEQEKREVIGEKVFELISKRDFVKAVEALEEYRKQNPSLYPISNLALKREPKRDIALLKVLFEGTPGILREMEADRLLFIRMIAALDGIGTPSCSRTHLPKDFETGIKLDGPAACRMFGFYANYVLQIEEYKQSGIKRVEISCSNDERVCTECRKIAGKKYVLSALPEIPNPKCTCTDGCRCVILADFGFLK